MRHPVKASIWEKDTFLDKLDIAVVGGGIVGINTALSLAEWNPELKIAIVERNSFPLGASTRNAGFACFGSLTEILDDLLKMEAKRVYELVNDRWMGLHKLRSRVRDDAMDFNVSGSYELFDKGDRKINLYKAAIPEINQKIYSVSGIERAFNTRTAPDFGFNGFDDFHIYNPYEGQLHPGKMMQSLYRLAANRGIRFISGFQVNQISESGDLVTIHGEAFELHSRWLIMATNGFTNTLMDIPDVVPARNQVIVTEPVPGLSWNACFHYDKGYIYFRNIGQRILLGGARNKAFEEENTTDLGQSAIIQQTLREFLYHRLGISEAIKIEHAWSGIMGVGQEKRPILDWYGKRTLLAVRLGGMGVALGSLVGEKAAQMVYSRIAKDIN